QQVGAVAELADAVEGGARRAALASERVTAEALGGGGLAEDPLAAPRVAADAAEASGLRVLRRAAGEPGRRGLRRGPLAGAQRGLDDVEPQRRRHVLRL